MLRSIADIARSEGEDLHAAEAKLACIEVFALGGPSHDDNALESGYYAIRGTLATSHEKKRLSLLPDKVCEGRASPCAINIPNCRVGSASLSARRKALQAIPVIGAIGGAAINLVFIDHFQDVSKGHFAVRRLERTYGPEVVQAEYSTIRG